MPQINITVNYEEVVALFSKERNKAFAYLMEKMINDLNLQNLKSKLEQEGMKEVSNEHSKNIETPQLICNNLLRNK